MPSASPYNDIMTAEELINSRTGVAFGRHGARSDERHWLVKTTNKFYGPNEICTATGVALPYEQYVMPEGFDLDTNLVCVELSARLVPQSEDDSRYWWIVTAKYGTDTPPEGIPAVTFLGNAANGSQRYPWQEPYLLRYESEVIQRAPQASLGLDAAGFVQPYNNSAKQPFTPPYTQDEGRRVVIVARNQQTFDFDAADAYTFAVNSDDFVLPGGTAPAGTAQCFPIHAEMLSRGLVNYWRVTYRIRIGAWVIDMDQAPEHIAYTREKFTPVKLLDAGLCRLQNVAGAVDFGKPVPIMGTFGRITQPDLLDGNGQPVQPDGSGFREPHYLEFDARRTLPFTPILTVGIG